MTTKDTTQPELLELLSVRQAAQSASAAIQVGQNVHSRERPGRASQRLGSRTHQSTHQLGGAVEVEGATDRLDTEADAQIRTGDPFITSEVLYQLSYVGEALTLAASGPRDLWSMTREERLIDAPPSPP
jgi:hypothetical protein